MSKELQISQPQTFDLIADIDLMQNAAKKLLQTKHYQALGEAGIFALIQKAKAVNLDPMEALNGGLYYLNGKVGMAAESMNRLIRSKGHSITKDPKSNDNVCILHGKRADTHDTWTESFSIDDAKRAGIYKNIWEKYPRNMCFNRALSNLARQLFPDVIGGCYEIEELRSFADPAFNVKETISVEAIPEMSSEDIENFYSNFNGDVEASRAYVVMCMSKKKWSESQTIVELQKDLEASHKAYTKWAAKNRPIETIIESKQDDEPPSVLVDVK